MNTDSSADTDATPPALHCDGLRKTFARGTLREVLAVDDLSLTLHPAETIALLGPSGCGKTTTLRLIAGFETPDAGRVLIGGREVVGPTAFLPPERRRVGMVFQDYALFPHLTVADNVAYGLPGSLATRWAPTLRRPLLALRHRLRRDRSRAPTAPAPGSGLRDARVHDALDLVALTHLAARFPHELSGGEAQRVALARALAPRPHLLLLDEPFSNLDAPLRASVRAEVREILQRAATATILVTHDQEEAFATADRVAVQLQGRIEQIGTPAEIYNRPATRAVAAFIGDADFLPGTLTPGARPQAVDTELGRIPLDGAPPHGDPPDDAKVDVMLRPERIHLAPHDTDDPTPAPTATHAPATDPLAIVESREFYGHDQLVTLRLRSGARIHARLGPDADFPPGRRATVSTTGAAVVYPRLTRTTSAPSDTEAASGETAKGNNSQERTM